MKPFMQSIVCLFAGIVLIMGSAGPCWAGAWTQAKGAMYNRLAFNYYRTDDQFDRERDRTDFAKNGYFRDINCSYYMEYGIFDSLTVLGSISYKMLRYEDDTIINKTEGFSDLELGARYRLFNTPGGVVSVQGLVKIPETYDKNDALPLGNGQYDTELRLLFGQSLYPLFPGYFNLEAGYRFRAEAPADEFRYLVEIGCDFSPSIYGRIKLDGIRGMNNAGQSTDANGNPSATLDYDIGKLDMALGYKVNPHWGIEAGCRPEIYGKNISAGVNWSLALVYLVTPPGR